MGDYVFEVTLDETLYRLAVRLADRRRQAVANVVQDLVHRGLRAPSLDRTGLGKRVRALVPPAEVSVTPPEQTQTPAPPEPTPATPPEQTQTPAPPEPTPSTPPEQTETPATPPEQTPATRPESAEPSAPHPEPAEA